MVLEQHRQRLLEVASRVHPHQMLVVVLVLQQAAVAAHQNQPKVGAVVLQRLAVVLHLWRAVVVRLSQLLAAVALVLRPEVLVGQHPLREAEEVHWSLKVEEVVLVGLCQNLEVSRHMMQYVDRRAWLEAMFRPSMFRGH